MVSFKSTRLGVFAGIVSLFLLVLFAIPITALSVAQGYFSNDPALQPGMVVQLASEQVQADTTLVERGSIDEPSKIIGLATSPADSFVIIASGEQQIYVQTTGESKALVSDINGTVAKGDQLTISPIRGILMKASENQGIKFGTALEDFNNTDAQSYAIDGGESGKSSTSVTTISVSLDGGSFAEQANDAGSSSVLSQLGQSIVGKSVGESRVLVGMIIFLIVLVSEGVIIYGAVSSSITALGRNPLAGGAIRKELIKVLVVAVIVLLVGLSAIYAILWI